MTSDRRIKMVFILIDGYAKQVECATANKDVTAFCGDTRETDDICVRSLDDEFRRTIQMEVLNPE